MSSFGSRNEILEQAERFRRFSEWEAANPIELTPQEKLAAISGIYRLLPPDAIARNESRDCDGFRRLLETLAQLRG